MLHHARALHHLREEHLALAKQVAHHLHAVHQRAFDHLQRHRVFLQRFFGVGNDEVRDAAQQRVLQALFHADFAPRQIGFDLLAAALALETLGIVHQDFRGIGTAVEQHVLHLLEHVLGDVFIDLEHAGVDDAHVHARLDGVVEEGAVHRFAHLVVAAEAETDVAHPAADLGTRQVLLDPARGVDEIQRVVVMLIHPGRDREDVRIKDDVLRREADLIHEDAVGALANADLLLIAGGLAVLIERHDHGGGTIALEGLRALDEGCLAFLQRDAVGDALALQALEAGLDDLPLRGVHHDRHLGHLGLGLQQDQELGHHRHPVDEAFVHAHVDHVRTVLHLLARDGDGLLKLVLLDQLGELGRARHVRALADHEVVRGGGEIVRQRSAQAHDRLQRRHMARLDAFHRFRDRGNVLGRIAAAAAHQIDEAIGGEVLGILAHVLGFQIKARGGERIRQAGVRIGRDKAIRLRRQFLQEGPHQIGAQRAVQTDRQRLHMPHGVQISLGRLRRNHRFTATAHRGRNHDGPLDAIGIKDFLGRHQRGLGVEGVEDGFDHDDVRTTGDQTANLQFIGRHHLVESHIAEGQVLGVRELRQRHRERSHSTGDVALAPGLLTNLIRPLPALLRRLVIDLPGKVVEEFVLDDLLEELRILAAALFARVFHEKLALGDAGAGERVGLDDVRSGLQEPPVNVLNDVRPRDRQDVAVVEQVLFVALEPGATRIGLLQPIATDRGPHRAINDGDAGAEQFFQFSADFRAFGHGSHVARKMSLSRVHMNAS